MVKSIWYCPCCGVKGEYTADEIVEVSINGLKLNNSSMQCICGNCGTDFIVDLDTTEEKFL